MSLDITFSYDDCKADNCKTLWGPRLSDCYYCLTMMLSVSSIVAVSFIIKKIIEWFGLEVILKIT